MDDFQSFGLPESMLNTLKNLKFTKPTDIQAEAIPLALEGHDILGTAQTGTGKTGAFGIPLIVKLMNDPKSSAIVITPTRELATQVMTSLQSFLGRKSNINTALLIGGDSMNKQFKQLAAKPRLFVGTPGRISDHIERGSLNLKHTNFLVLDEMDRMLDMGFSVQVDEIVKFMSKQRQTLLFSATLPKNILKAAEAYQNNPKRIAIGSTNEPVKNIKQETVFVGDSEKFDTLSGELNKREGSIIVFVKTKYGAEKIARKLRKEKHQADAIHGDLRHNQRERVIKDFRDSEFRVLVATDVAARGLDIPHIEHVINYDLPHCPEDYIHRIGRTARAGAEGQALCLVSPADKENWHAINLMLNPELAAQEAAAKKARSGGGRGTKDYASRKKPLSKAGKFFERRQKSRMAKTSKAA